MCSLIQAGAWVGFRLLGALFVEGCVCIVQAGKRAGLPSVLLEEGASVQISGIQVTHLLLCLPVSDPLETGLLALLSLTRVQMWKRIRQSHEHRQRQTQGEPRGQNHHASGA